MENRKNEKAVVAVTVVIMIAICAVLLFGALMLLSNRDYTGNKLADKTRGYTHIETSIN